MSFGTSRFGTVAFGRAPAAAGGTTYSDTISDALTGTDTVAAAVTARPSFTDSITGADTAAAIATFNASVTDAGTGGDSLSGAATLSAALSDTLAGADTVAAAATVRPTLSDGATGGDTVAVAATFAPTLSDGVTGAGSAASGASTFAPSLADSITGADTAAALLTARPTIADGVTGADTATGSLGAATYNDSIADGLAAADALSPTATCAPRLADALIVTDTLAAVASFIVSLSDAVTGGDGAATAAGGVGLEQAIYETLAADQEVADLVSTRIYPVLAPQGAPRPYIVFARQAQETLGALTRTPATHRQVQISVMCFADTAGEALALGRAARNALDGVHGGRPLQSVRLISRLQSPVGEIGADPVVIADALLFQVLSTAA